jgi:hypothetical protein
MANQEITLRFTMPAKGGNFRLWLPEHPSALVKFSKDLYKDPSPLLLPRTVPEDQPEEEETQEQSTDALSAKEKELVVGTSQIYSTAPAGFVYKNFSF